mmetsp:Transcript_32919/g.87325  ORF Transcript_32919/g.87325 Transcript_32919/m.87325 type:complete len:126 (-) Transcript_32919:273-650(-)|eukprot:CAMPEP_0113680204 /NCGR_PEP_ID=MMETSP0038_2-20120614/11155_1 /TAXON_ID=2898 /ORGANISM="Cryptomonas paramecium" /LENGTH=125 /DNA_ID=CAMNT_0000598491 /DNA_START=16 /DNA_END=393 /DNA_ORIENTATION=+ /assembly_acc=CAM_ASM_000170
MASKVVKAAADTAAQAAKSAGKKTYNKVYFPNEIITLMNPVKMSELTEPTEAIKVRVNPKLTRVEIKNWMEALYDTPVKRVNTANYEGKIQRVPGGKGYYKRPDFKVGYVALDNPWMLPKTPGKK